MARTTTTHYRCDSCGREIKTSRDLQRFAVEQISRGRRQNKVIAVDLCGECEPRFLAAVEPFFAGEDLPVLHAMSREEE
jgi:DNA-directed RNA polymerase subunit RPC12/RpoP